MGSGFRVAESNLEDLFCYVLLACDESCQVQSDNVRNISSFTPTSVTFSRHQLVEFKLPGALSPESTPPMICKYITSAD